MGRCNAMGETYQDTKHLGYEPSVTRDARPVLEQLLLRPFDVVHDIFSVAGLASVPGSFARDKGNARVGVDALDHLRLLANH